MARGISLHVGVNDPSNANFPSAATLLGAQNDAVAMRDIAKTKGFAHELLLADAATLETVTARIKAAAATLQAGDIFLFTFAGHGYQQSDQEDEEPDDEDEVLVLFDKALLDDVFRKDLLPLFKPGVRVLGIVDACHSHSVLTRPAPTQDYQTDQRPPIFDVLPENEIPVFTPDGLLARTLSRATGQQHFNQLRGFYRKILLSAYSPAINANVLVLAACRANQTTGDGNPNGVYTAAMLKVLSDSSPPQNYDDLVTRIHQKLQPQRPTIQAFGQSPSFRTQIPFTI